MPIPLGILAVAGAGGSGGGGPAFDLLETTILGSNTASITFSNLGNYSDYKHLQIRMTGRGSDSFTFGNFRLRFNSDTGTNYSSHFLYGTGSSVLPNASINRPNIDVGFHPDNNVTASAFAGVVIDILDFSNTNKAKTIRALGGYHAASSPHIFLTSGRWGNTNAITAIQVYSSSTNLVTGSRFSLYGIK